MRPTLLSVFFERGNWFADLLFQHLALSVLSIVVAAVLGLSLGIAIAQWRRGAKPVLGLINFVYTIPSIALFGFLIPLTGIGNITAVVALSIYGLLPIVRNTYTGLTTIDPAIIEAARGMGSTNRQLLYRIELPLAAPIIMSGLRNMATMTIALAGIASFIGAGGLGVAIYRGITTNNLFLTLDGSILIALLAIVIDLLLGIGEKRASRHLRPRTETKNSLLKKVHRSNKLKLSQPRRASNDRTAANSPSSHAPQKPLRRPLKLALIGSCALLMLIGSFIYINGIAGKDTKVLHLATKPMTEQFILGEMLKALIEHDTDLRVETTQGVGGGTSNIEPALEKGDFDLYPEYTGTGWNAVLKHEDTYDESKFNQMQSEYETERNLTWKGAYGFNNTFSLAVSAEVAQHYHLQNFSDLANVADKLSFGAEPDFYDRQDGYPGLLQSYKMNFGTTRDMDISLKYRALFDGQVDVIPVSTTDGQASDERLVVLDDNQHFYPSYLCENVVRLDALQKFPQLSDELLKLQGLITNSTMASLNSMVDIQGQEPQEVAKDFLKQKGLI